MIPEGNQWRPLENQRFLKEINDFHKQQMIPEGNEWFP